jgi:hypothetical protein
MPIRYESNDDVMMLCIASGAYTGTPDPHLVYINYIYGVFLVFLYKLFPSLEWYTVIFCILHVISLSIISWAILKKGKPLLHKAIFLLLLYIFELRIVLFFQFTTTAGLCAFAGLLLILENKNIKLMLLGMLLFLLGFLIRDNLAIFLYILFLPVFVYELITSRVCKYIVPVLICCFIGGFIFKTVHVQMYKSDAQWSYYRDYNRARSSLNDRSNRIDAYNHLPKSVSKESFYLFLNFFADGKIIDIENLQQINNSLVKDSYISKLGNIYKSFRRHARILSIVFFMCVGGILICLKNKEKRWLLVFYLVYYFGLLGILSVSYRINDRVLIPSFMVVFFTLFYVVDKFSIKKVSGVIYIVFVSYFGVLLTERTFSLREIGFSKIESFQKQKKLQQYADSQGLSIMLYLVDFMYEKNNPFTISKDFYMNTLVYGWMTNSPLNKGRIDTYQSFVDSDIVLFLGKEDEKELLNNLQKVLLDYYDCKTEKIEIAGDDITSLIKLRSVKETDKIDLN